MPVFLLALITALFIILVIPTASNKQKNIREFRELFPCSPHTWVNKPSGFDDGSTYRVCEKCKFLAGGGYEV